MNPHRNIANVILIGMPAVGKSTLGVLLAKRLGFAFMDTDLIIQTDQNATLSEIIRRRGMAAFCRIEADIIQNLSTVQTVIATGGSVVYSDRAMTRLNQLGRILFLDIDLAPLVDRLSNLDSRGVVYMPGQTIKQLYDERRPLYRRHAHLTIPCTDRTPEQLVQRMLADLGQDPLFRFR
jgi:shikimate kinase